jgi:hypothetical protein
MKDVSTLPPDLATARLMASSRQATARLARLAWQNPEGLAAAVAAVRSATAELWPQVPPEAARDAMLSAAATASLNGVIEPPAITGISDGVLADVERMLDLADEWFIVQRHHAARGLPKLGLDQSDEASELAGSLVFDRNYDQEVFATLSVLLTLAALATPFPTRRAGLWLE